MPEDFQLDAKLAADTIPVAELTLCTAVLMNDSRFPWLILVPRRPGLAEIIDLGEADRAALLDEIALASRALRALHPGCKLNVAALGNVVSQLHVHVIARHAGDAAWPKPVWGVGERTAYSDGAAAQRIAKALREAAA
ncbi:MAG: HIT domain-containing protein [Flavobacteriaceae bacterium]